MITLLSLCVRTKVQQSTIQIIIFAEAQVNENQIYLFNYRLKNHKTYMKKAAIIIVLVFTASLVLSSCRTRKSCPGVYSDQAQTEQPAEKA